MNVWGNTNTNEILNAHSNLINTFNIKKINVNEAKCSKKKDNYYLPGGFTLR